MDCTVHQHTFSFTWQHCCGSRTDSFDTFICYKYNNCRKHLKYVQNIADRLPVQAAFYDLWYMRLKLEVAPNLMASCLVSNQPRYMTIYIAIMYNTFLLLQTVMCVVDEKSACWWSLWEHALVEGKTSRTDRGEGGRWIKREREWTSFFDRVNL